MASSWKSCGVALDLHDVDLSAPTPLDAARLAELVEPLADAQAA